MVETRAGYRNGKSEMAVMTETMRPAGYLNRHLLKPRILSSVEMIGQPRSHDPQLRVDDWSAQIQ